MIITKYICDCCGKELRDSDVYSISIKQIMNPLCNVYGAGCNSLNNITKHICYSCLDNIFIHHAKNTQDVMEGGE